MHVYLDAVFYPNIYQKEEIFRQEGWSYKLEKPEDELTYNGVVYNEMKGAFSSSDEVLERKIMDSLFPDTTYGEESGGRSPVHSRSDLSAVLGFSQQVLPSLQQLHLSVREHGHGGEIALSGSGVLVQL